ncbi:MAG: hypothetical protein ACM3N7_09065, partial [Planctomycetaceae bacterium]
RPVFLLGEFFKREAGDKSQVGWDQGQNNWLLRGSMPKSKGEPSPALGNRESPYEKPGETNR